MENPTKKPSHTPFYYYPHYCYVKLRSQLEYYYSFGNNNDLHEVYDNIYVGNISTAYNKDKLKELGINNVITAISGMPEIYPEEFNYMLVDALDIQQQDMRPMFDDTSKFIKDSLKDGGKVYIHCMCGVSRSVAIVCAYLAKEYGIEPEEAIKTIREIRPKANPNPSFQIQLQNYHHTVSNKNEDTL
jgi:protein-tyrosine phosphatase